MRTKLPFLVLCTLTLSSAAFAARPTGKGPCKDAGQCRGGVCVEVNGDAYCSKTCGDCPAGMYCDERLFSAVGMKVCLRGRAKAPVEPKSPPRLPCKTDDNCQGALICAEMMGHRDCTLPCTTEAQCDAPEVMGVKMDFLSCQVDEGDRKRKACLPKKACMANPMQCMSMDPSATTGMVKGMMKMTQGLAKGMEEAMPEDEDSADLTPSPAAPPAAAPTEAAMSAKRFDKLLAQVKAAAFEDDRATILRTAAKRNHFTCGQLARIVEVIAFGDEKVDAVRIVATRLVDKENSHEVLSKFTFDDDRAEAARILNAD